MTRHNRDRALLLLAGMFLLGTLTSAWATEVPNYTISDLNAWSEARVGELYGALMAADSIDEIYPIMDGTSDAAFASFLAALPVEKAAALASHLETFAPGQETWRVPVDFTSAAPLLAQPEEGTVDDGVALFKDVAANADGSFTITLEAFLTGSAFIPADIILALDQSGNMEDSFGYSYEAVNGARYFYQEKGGPTRAAYGFGQAGDEGRQFFILIEDGVYQSVTRNINRDGNGFDSYYYEISGTRTYVYPRLGVEPSDTSRANAYNIAQFYTRSGTRRLEALKSSAVAFSEEVAEKAKGADGIYGTPDDVKHRIAIVGFASSGTEYVNDPYENTELFIGSAQYGYGSAVEQYGAALQDMLTSAGRSNVARSVGALDARGCSCPQYALAMANGIFDANPVASGESRVRVIIVFSAGMPGNGTVFSDAEANAALGRARTAKSNGATIYTVGAFSGADAGSPGSPSGGNESKSNIFMHLLSSNDPGALSISGAGPDPDEVSYYLSASSASALKSAFGRIAARIAVKCDSIGAEAAIREIIAPSFVLPECADVALYAADCAGTDGDGNYTWKTREPASAKYEVGTDADGRAFISATGFNYVENRVSSDGLRGRKFIVEFRVQARDDFLGGNNVPVDDSASGLYRDKTLLKAFHVPVVNVPIPALSLEPMEDRNVYLLGDLSEDDLLTGAAATAQTRAPRGAGIRLQPDQANYGLLERQNEYVDIRFGISTDDDSFERVGFADLTEDRVYWLTATVSPKTAQVEGVQGAGAVKTSDRKSVSIHVFVPELSFRDGEVWYGGDVPENPDYFNLENWVGTAWKHGETRATDVLITGTEPALKLEYVLASCTSNGKIDAKEDIQVNVAVSLNNGTMENPDWVSVTDAVQFVCGDGAAQIRGRTATSSGGAVFLLRVGICQLTIANIGGAQDESYVFNIYRDGTEYMTVAVWGNGSVTIRELPVGTYAVVAEAAWSWRWTGTLDAEAVLNSSNCSARVTCVNEANGKTGWLNGYGAATTQSGKTE